MMLRELQVLHANQAVAQLPEALLRAGTDGRTFLIHTCQRLVAVQCGAQMREAMRPLLGPGAELHEGPRAYAFLLRLACGLESRLPGETEVLGQLKQSWAGFEAGHSLLAQQLNPFMQSLFRDVKDVRSRFLSGLGSASYGSLVRRLLDVPGEAGPVLLVGAGQLAESVAPWLRGSELWIANRGQPRALQLADKLQQRNAARPVRVMAPGLDAELAAWRAARDVVVCVPGDAALDAARAAAWRAARPSRGQLIHLGIDDGSDASDWAGAPAMLNLGAVYALMQAHDELRRAQMARAERACTERSLLRALGHSDSEPHGWEDLIGIHSLVS